MLMIVIFAMSVMLLWGLHYLVPYRLRRGHWLARLLIIVAISLLIAVAGSYVSALLKPVKLPEPVLSQQSMADVTAAEVLSQRTLPLDDMAEVLQSEANWQSKKARATVYLRTGPGTEYPSQGKLTRGQAVDVDINSIENNWVRVRTRSDSDVMLYVSTLWLDLGATDVPK
jgi:hypothetical protein